MHYDNDGKYYRKQVFNENFKYTFGLIRKNNNNSKIIDAITSLPSSRDVRVHDVCLRWHRLKTQKCIPAEI
tara:strand:- start:139 stop:351 length:213 start_codon:yes stop_codon:yes gene_type:complete